MLPNNIFKLIIVILLSISTTAFAGKKEKISRVTFEVKALCENHVEKIQQFFINQKAIKNVEIVLNDKMIKIIYDRNLISKSKLKAAIKNLGLDDVTCVNEKTALNNCGCGCDENCSLH